MLRGLHRSLEKPMPVEQKEALIQDTVQKILKVTKPNKLILFGSAVDGKFDSYSDFDFVLIYENRGSVRAEQKKVNSIKAELLVESDFLCVDEETFNSKSKIGGVFLIAAEDGRNIPT